VYATLTELRAMSHGTGDGALHRVQRVVGAEGVGSGPSLDLTVTADNPNGQAINPRCQCLASFGCRVLWMSGSNALTTITAP
jgi:hypothetical protein